MGNEEKEEAEEMEVRLSIGAGMLESCRLLVNMPNAVMTQGTFRLTDKDEVERTFFVIITTDKGMKDAMVAASVALEKLQSASVELECAEGENVSKFRN